MTLQHPEDVYCEDHGLTFDEIVAHGASQQVRPNRISFPVHSPSGVFLRNMSRLESGSFKWVWDEMPEGESAHSWGNKVLYGFPQAAPSILSSGECIYVEGIMDAIAMWKIGFTNTVAVMSSRLLEPQIVIPLRLGAKKHILFFDGDETGITGVKETMKAIGDKYNIESFYLPGYDPAKAIAKGAAPTIEKCLAGLRS